MIASSPAARSETQALNASSVVWRNVADMNTAVIKVEVECLWFAFSEGERCCRFGGSVKRCSSVRRRRRGLLDVAEDTAGADRGELLIITDQSDTRTAIDGELHGRVEGQGVGHAGFVDDQQGRRADRCRPVRQLAVLQGPGQFGECVGADAGLLAEHGRCGCGRGEADHLAAVLGPGQGQGAHGGGFPGAGRGDRELQTSPRRAHLPDQGRLPGIQGGCRSPPSPATPGPPPPDRRLTRRVVRRR
jgi:hypothetical protein